MTGDEIKKVESSDTSGTSGGKKKRKERDHMEDRGGNGKIILK